MKKVIAICGSTKSSSSNLKLLKLIKELASDRFETIIFEGIANIPHFNPDIDTAPAEVKHFRNLLSEADGILICTPEYAMGVPGTLKNAIDWTVSSMEFSQKPTALITASSVGQKGHASLLETLKVIEAKMSTGTQLIIPFINARINSEGKITDEKTLADVKQVISGLEELMLNEQI